MCLARHATVSTLIAQHPLYFLPIHSRASFCAAEMSAGVIFLATVSLASSTYEHKHYAYVGERPGNLSITHKYDFTISPCLERLKCDSCLST